MSVPMRFVYLALIAASWGIQGTQGQRTIQILVGQQGNFYDPNAVIAGENDIVRFFFYGAAHGVVQTSFENPCVPLPGGFSSGVTGVGSDPAHPKLPIPFWDLKITNATMPIWYYCPVTRPSSHCATGMGGVINPPGMGVAAIASFTNSAKQFTGTPIPAGTVLSGIGAFATDTPAPSVLVTPTSSTMPTTSTPTTSSPSEDSRSSSSNVPAIIGGTVAGVVAVLAAIVIVVWIARRRPQRSQESMVEAYDYPQGHTSPPMSARSDVSKFSEQQTATPTLGALYPVRRPEAEHSTSSAADPRFRGSGKHTVRNATSAEQLTAPVMGRHVENPDDERAGNLNSLAKEVAAVLLRNASNSRAEANPSQGAREQDEAPPRYKSNLGHTPPS